MPVWGWVAVGLSVGATLFMVAMGHVAARADREARERVRERVFQAHGRRGVGGS